MKKQLYKLKSGFRIKEIDEERYVIRGVFSTGGEDRHGEIVDQTGWNLEEFMENPVIMLFHDHQRFPVGQCIELGINQEGNLAGAIKFAVEEDVSGVARTAYNLYKNRFMRGFSVGFACEEVVYEPDSDKVILRRNTLHEISCVNVGAAAGALAAAKGIDMDPITKAVEEMRARASREAAPDGTMTSERAIEIISKSDRETIEGAVRALTDALKTLSNPDEADKAEAGAKVERSAKADGDKRIPVTMINRAIRSLLAVKKMK